MKNEELLKDLRKTTKESISYQSLPRCWDDLVTVMFEAAYRGESEIRIFRLGRPDLLGSEKSLEHLLEDIRLNKDQYIRCLESRGFNVRINIETLPFPATVTDLTGSCHTSLDILIDWREK